MLLATAGVPKCLSAEALVERIREREFGNAIVNWALSIVNGLAALRGCRAPVVEVLKSDAELSLASFSAIPASLKTQVNILKPE